MKKKTNYAARRASFMARAALKWVRENRPDVERLIREESCRAFPQAPRRNKRHDYAFLERASA